MKQIVKKTGKIILTDSYQENIMELMPGLRHMGIQNVLEKIAYVPKQAPSFPAHLLALQKSCPHLDPITFIPAQTTPFPIDGDEDVHHVVTIGPKAKKPMKNQHSAYDQRDGLRDRTE